MSKLTIAQYEQAHEYMAHYWCRDEGFSDFQAFDEAGDTELLADGLVSAGAIDSKACYPEFKGVERLVERIARAYRKKSRKARLKQLNAAMADTIVVACEDCNHVQFPSRINYSMYETEFLKCCWSCGEQAITTQPWSERHE